MASTNDLIRKMILAHESGDRSAFHEAVRDLVAEERRKNHHLYARDIERLLFNGIASQRDFDDIANMGFRSMDPPRDEDRGLLLLEIKEPKRQLEDLVLAKETRLPLEKILNESKHGELLESYGLKPCRKLLFFGPPGCGKTAAAECIATELFMPFVVVRFDGIVSSYLGETAANLRRVFEFLRTTPCIALFDEFDAIGKKRTDVEEHGELKRAVNSFLQILDSFVSESIIIAATNHEHLLDTALWRRFDEVVHFGLPSLADREKLLAFRLRHATNISKAQLKQVARMTTGFAYADIERVAIDALKDSVLSEDRSLSMEILLGSVARQQTRLQSIAGTVERRTERNQRPGTSQKSRKPQKR